MTNNIRAILAILALTVLSACGGGGGSAGNTSGNAFFLTAPDKITVAPGEVRTYGIGGGVPGYTASSSSTAAIAKVVGNSLNITGGGGGTSTIVVVDASGASQKIEVTVGSGFDFYTTAPSVVTVAVDAISDTYAIGGGSLIYSVASSDINVAKVTLAGRNFVIQGVGNGKAIVAVKDNLGNEVTIDVVAGTDDTLFTDANSSVTIAVGMGNIYKIGGGTKIYTATSSNTSVATASIVGNSLTVSGIVAGTATVVVKDSVGKTLTISVTIGDGQVVKLFTTAASDTTIPLAVFDKPSYTIGGGRPPYQASSANVGVVKGEVVIGGNLLIITPVALGVSSIVVTDAAGSTVTIKVTVN